MSNETPKALIAILPIPDLGTIATNNGNVGPRGTSTEKKSDNHRGSTLIEENESKQSLKKKKLPPIGHG